MTHSGTAQLNPNIQAYWVQKLSPKVRLALRAYASGSVRTAKEAAAMAGITKEYFYLLQQNPIVIQWLEEFQNKMDAATVDHTALIKRLAGQALERMEDLIESGDERVALSASTDILDRFPETSRVNRMQVESFSLSGRDARAIAEALVSGKTVSEQFPDAASGSYDRIGLLPSPEEPNVSDT